MRHSSKSDIPQHGLFHGSLLAGPCTSTYRYYQLELVHDSEGMNESGESIGMSQCSESETRDGMAWHTVDEYQSSSNHVLSPSAQTAVALSCMYGAGVFNCIRSSQVWRSW